MKIGANVKFYNYEMRAAREKLKMSQTKLAYLVGCNVHIINYIENLIRPLNYVDPFIQTTITVVLRETFPFLVYPSILSDYNTFLPVYGISVLDVAALSYRKPYTGSALCGLLLD